MKQTALTQVKNHYENFPVAPFFFPKNIRQAIATIYQFARTADDIADEGSAPTQERLQALKYQKTQLINIRKNKTIDPAFQTLQQVIQQHDLPIQLFLDLLDAFIQDCIKKRYHHFQDVLNYCQYSANPIGRLLLHLTKTFTPKRAQYSDHLCTALQLINFLQDFSEDYLQRNRIYIPQIELEAFQLSEQVIASQQHPAYLQKLMQKQLKRIEHLLERGLPLTKELTGLIGLDVRLIIISAKQMLKKIHHRTNPYQRPLLTKTDWGKIICVAAAKTILSIDI